MRGFHGNFTTWKLVQCVYGSVFIVVFDPRKIRQVTLKRYFCLDDKNKNQLLIHLAGVNAWLTTSKKKVFFSIKKSEYFFANDEVFLPYDHKKIGIIWPVDKPILSRKDSSKDYDYDFHLANIKIGGINGKNLEIVKF